MYVDLHIHSCFSDGTYTPREIVSRALAQSVSTMSITDHNILGAYPAFPAACAAAGINWVSGLELDCLRDGVVYHVLGYGFDLGNTSFSGFVAENRKTLDQMSIDLVARMSGDYDFVSSSEYEKYDYDKTRGGWKGINYLLDMGITSTLMDGMRLYGEYGIVNSEYGFASVEDTCRRVKAAGGVSVLAHPCDKIALDGDFERKLDRLREQGIEGVECYYPLQDDAYTQACLKYCITHDMAITCGSDFHGAFVPDSQIGVPRATMEMLRLERILENRKS